MVDLYDFECEVGSSNPGLPINSFYYNKYNSPFGNRAIHSLVRYFIYS